MYSPIDRHGHHNYTNYIFLLNKYKQENNYLKEENKKLQKKNKELQKKIDFLLQQM